MLEQVDDKRLGDVKRLNAELERDGQLQVETGITRGSRSVVGFVGGHLVRLFFCCLFHLLAIHASTHQAGEVVVGEVRRRELQPAILVVGDHFGHVVAQVIVVALQGRIVRCPDDVLIRPATRVFLAVYNLGSNQRHAVYRLGFGDGERKFQLGIVLHIHLVEQLRPVVTVVIKVHQRIGLCLEGDVDVGDIAQLMVLVVAHHHFLRVVKRLKVGTADDDALSARRLRNGEEPQFTQASLFLNDVCEGVGGTGILVECRAHAVGNHLDVSGVTIGQHLERLALRVVTQVAQFDIIDAIAIHVDSIRVDGCPGHNLVLVVEHGEEQRVVAFVEARSDPVEVH